LCGFYPSLCIAHSSSAQRGSYPSLCIARSSSAQLGFYPSLCIARSSSAQLAFYPSLCIARSFSAQRAGYSVPVHRTQFFLRSMRSHTVTVHRTQYLGAASGPFRPCVYCPLTACMSDVSDYVYCVRLMYCLLFVVLNPSSSNKHKHDYRSATKHS
jgi:hypothetical protein